MAPFTLYRWMMFILTTALIIGLAGPAAAGEYGDWSALTDHKGTGAFTSNDSEQVFGMLCTPGQGCEWRVTLRTSCVLNNTYSALAATSVAATALTVRCLGILDSGKAYRYSFTDGAQMMSLVAGEQGGRIKFVIPQPDVQFMVVQFSLLGAKAALEEALTTAKLQKTPAPSAPTGTKDTLL